MRLYREDLAYVHDRGFSALSEAAGSWLIDHLERSNLPVGLILDLGCGTGRFAAMLSTAGYSVWGVDASRAMVRLARASAPLARFRVGSMYTAPWPDQAIAVTVIGEGLNYVQPSGRRPPLTTFFRRVHRTLTSRGLLLFDLITGPLSRLVPGRGFACGDDWAVGYEAVARRSRNTFYRTITTFRLDDRGCYRRSVEKHSICVYPIGDITTLLRRTGFSVRVLSGYDDKGMLTGRSVFAAHKRRS